MPLSPAPAAAPPASRQPPQSTPSTGTASETSPTGNYWSTPKSGISALASYGTSANTTMATDAVDVSIAGNGGGITGGTVAVENNGGGQPMSIMQPTLGMQYIICMQGIFPSRN